MTKNVLNFCLNLKNPTFSISLNRPTLQKQRRKSEDTMLDIDADETTDLVL